MSRADRPPLHRQATTTSQLGLERVILCPHPLSLGQHLGMCYEIEQLVLGAGDAGEQVTLSGSLFAERSARVQPGEGFLRFVERSVELLVKCCRAPKTRQIPSTDRRDWVRCCSFNRTLPRLLYEMPSRSATA